MCRIIFFIIFVFSHSFAQQEDENIVVIGDSLFGKIINGESVREVVGNVTLKQGNVTVTCDKAIQYLARNEAELVGNVVARQDSLTLITARGFYFGNLRIAKSSDRITMDDMKVVLSADSGVYYFNDSRAFFQSNVVLKDSLTILFADEMTYYKKEDKSVAVSNVKVIDNKSELRADTLVHFRKNKTSIADGNVLLKDFDENTTIFANHLEDYGKKKFTLINENPLLLQIDTTFTTEIDSTEKITIDTLLISCKLMEGYRDSTDLFKAIDSVKIIRGGFASRNDLTILLRSEDRLITKKIDEDAASPVLWYENSQLTGDSISILLEGNDLKLLEVYGNAFMISQNTNFSDRFDQSSSTNTKMHFENNKLFKAEFDEKVQNIYYLFEDEKPSGLTKSASMSAVILFEEEEVSEVRLYGSPTSEFYPEEKVSGLERTFTLPKFAFYENKPAKKEMFGNLKIIY
jgi:lipopolysaccharide export system protein LptA